jgi:hypothetical protein
MVEMRGRPFASFALRGAAVAVLLAPLWLADCGSSGGDCQDFNATSYDDDCDMVCTS